LRGGDLVYSEEEKKKGGRGGEDLRTFSALKKMRIRSIFGEKRGGR